MTAPVQVPIAELIRRAVDAAPPLTDEQTGRIAALLPPPAAAAEQRQAIDTTDGQQAA